MDAAKLGYLVEATFPSPIALAFAEMRRREPEGRDTQLPARVLEATIEFLAFVAVSDAYAATLRDETSEARALRQYVAEEDGIGGLARPASAGKMVQVIHHSVRAMAARSLPTTLPHLISWHQSGGGRFIEAAVASRNRMHAGDAGYGTLKRHSLRILVSLVDLLAGAHLVYVESLTLVQGTRRAKLRAFEGVESVGRTLELSEEIETDRVYLVVPRIHALLSLDPLARFRKCPKCEVRHLFTLETIDKGRGTLVSVGAGAMHRIKARDTGTLVGALGLPEGRRYFPERLSLSSSPRVGSRLRTGERVADRYVVQRLVGEGGMGQVYAAVDEQTAQPVALKILPYPFLRDRSIVERFRAEAAYARELSHPRIVRVLDQGESRGDHYLILELATGWSIAGGRRTAIDLSQVAKPMEPAMAVEIARSTCEALGYLHERGVVHRDVKPQNILLFADGSVKLGDFGIARSRESITLTMTGQLLGTPEYVSPEQANGEELDGRSDLYSLGVVLYELLCGQLPYKAATPMATALKHLNEREPIPALPGVVPQSLADVVHKALQKRREDRHQSALEFISALDDWKVMRGQTDQRGPHEEASGDPDLLNALASTLTDSLQEGHTAVAQAAAGQLSPLQIVARWVAFLPLAALAVGAAQLAVALVTERIPQWIAVSVCSFIGTAAAMAIFQICRMTSDRKVAATIFLTLFVPLEILALYSGHLASSGFSLIMRLWCDLGIMVGALVAGQKDD